MENNKVYQQLVELSKSGLPVMWESGGGCSNTGSSVVIAGENGQKLKPLFIQRRGHLSNDRHALFVIEVGHFIVEISISRGSTKSAKISRVIEINENVEYYGINYKKITLETVNTWSQGEWSVPLEEKFLEVGTAGFNKACDYHCRTVYYAL